MDNFSKLLNEALGNGETIESAFRSAVAKAAQEAIDSFMESCTSQEKVDSLLSFF